MLVLLVPSVCAPACEFSRACLRSVKQNCGSQLIVSVAPWCSGVSGVCGGMDPKPDHLEVAGEIWVGGRWPGFDTWVREKPELVIISCMHHKFAGPHNCWLHVNHGEKVDGKDWWQRHRQAFLLFVQASTCSAPLYAWVAPDGRECEFLSCLVRVGEE